MKELEAHRCGPITIIPQERSLKLVLLNISEKDMNFITINRREPPPSQLYDVRNRDNLIATVKIPKDVDINSMEIGHHLNWVAIFFERRQTISVTNYFF